MRWIPVTLLLSLCGCTGFYPLDLNGEYLIDETFSDERKGAIRIAVLRWSEATGGKVNFKESNNSAAPFRFFSSKPEDGEDGNRISLMSSDAGIFIRYDIKRFDDLGIDYFLTTTMHFIGHALELDHESSGLMSAKNYERRPCIDRKTLDAFCDAYKCPAAAHVNCSE